MTQPIIANVAVQLSPLNPFDDRLPLLRAERERLLAGDGDEAERKIVELDGVIAELEAVQVDLQEYAEQLVRYLAQQFERFAERRKGDVFLAVTLERGEQRAGHVYRSGHYVIDGEPDEPAG